MDENHDNAVQLARLLKAAADVIAGGMTGGIYGAAVQAVRHLWPAALAVLLLLFLPVLLFLCFPADLLSYSTLETPFLAGYHDTALAMRKEYEKYDGCIQGFLQEIEKNHIHEDTESTTYEVEFSETGVRMELNWVKAIYSVSCKNDLAGMSEQEYRDFLRRLFTYETSKASETSPDGGITHKTVTTTIHITWLSPEELMKQLAFEQEEKDWSTNIYESLTAEYHASGGETIGGDVYAYDGLIMQYAKQYHVEPFIEVIRAIMMVESGGSGTDPMQCSECPFNTRYPNQPGAIQDPAYSIEVGIHYFASCLSDAGCKSPSDKNRLYLALQGYNFGGGYIRWALHRYGGYSPENAREFSDMKKQQLGLSRYGAPKYVQAVLKYYVPGSGDKDWGSPFVGMNWRACVTSEFGSRTDPITGKPGAFHGGVDIAMPYGTPVNATHSGRVVSAGWDNSYGNYVKIDCGDGIETLYGHCSQLLVKRGDTVQRGQMIAKVGSTGDSTGNHCHYEVRKNGTRVQPRPYMS